jgi:hypothetical protein
VGSPTPTERFKWTLLIFLVFEDYQSLWEQPWMTDEAPRVEQAMRELYRDGLIYLFRTPAPGAVNASGVDPTLRLSDAEIEIELDRGRRTDWLQAPEDRDLPDIWIGPTADGETAANDPPEAVRRLDWL